MADFSVRTLWMAPKTVNNVSASIECGKSFGEVVKCNDLPKVSVKVICDVTTKAVLRSFSSVFSFC